MFPPNLPRNSACVFTGTHAHGGRGVALPVRSFTSEFLLSTKVNRSRKRDIGRFKNGKTYLLVVSLALGALRD